MVKRLIAILLLSAFLVTVPFGRTPAMAINKTLETGLIISGAIAGATALILLIAIGVASANPDFMEVAPGADPLRATPDDGIRTTTQCPRTAEGNLPVLCW